MLVLSRKKNQTIWVGEVPITIVEIRGDKVKLGISAPPGVVVDRDEVRTAKLRSNQAIKV